MKFVDVYQAIETKYHVCTNHKPARISATAAAKRIIISYEHGLNLADNHKHAALILADKLGWNDISRHRPTHWVSGQLKKW